MTPNTCKECGQLSRLSAKLALGLILAAAQGLAESVYTPYTFITLAGGFNAPSGVAVDSTGNVYVADVNNHTVLKGTPTAVLTILAGSPGNKGSDDGTGSAARFNGPSGVTVDNAGNLYVADYANFTIRKVTPDGDVTTLAGLAGTPGSDDGIGTAARFNYAFSLAADKAGNLYVADTYNYTIRKVTLDGMVTTLAGLAGSHGHADGTGSAARFEQAHGITVDDAGNLYVADTYNHAIRKVTPEGVVTTLAGLPHASGNADGPGGVAQFFIPFGVAVDAVGNVYVGDTANNTIRRVTPEGLVTTLGGVSATDHSYQDGTGSAARFISPEGIAVDGEGNLYVADYGGQTIRKGKPAVYTPYTFTTLAGNAGFGSTDGKGSFARFNNPAGVT